LVSHPNRRVYPNTMLVDECRKHGVDLSLAWEIPGPKNTGVVWLSCYGVVGRAGPLLVIVETFRDGGWQAFTHDRSNKVQDTVADVLSRCLGMKVTPGEPEPAVSRDDAIRRCTHPDCGRFEDRAGIACRASACAVAQYPDRYLGPKRGEDPDNPPARIEYPQDDGSCDPLYGKRIDSAD
jgi:hypothetical protein